MSILSKIKSFFIPKVTYVPEQVAQFSKVSYMQFKSDFRKTFNVRIREDELKKIYNEIKIPERGTNLSAGYDFFIPFGINLAEGESIVIPTGIRCKCQPDFFLGIFPRSGLGFKHRTMLANTVGIIDADYYTADNEGHIMIKLVHQGFVYKTREYTIERFSSSDDIEDEDLYIQGWKSDKPYLDNLVIKKGEKFAQGILMPYGIVFDEESPNKERKGGFGSTDK